MSSRWSNEQREKEKFIILFLSSCPLNLTPRSLFFSLSLSRLVVVVLFLLYFYLVCLRGNEKARHCRCSNYTMLAPCRSLIDQCVFICIYRCEEKTDEKFSLYSNYFCPTRVHTCNNLSGTVLSF